MRPNSVLWPVAKVTALAVPFTTDVPMNTTLRLSSRSVSGPAGSSVRPTGSLSPVRATLFTLKSWASTTRQSHEIASPASRVTRSPGTRSSAAISIRSPSRMTRHAFGTMALRASAVRSAEYSWKKPMTAFSSTTPRIAIASCRLPTSRGVWMKYATNVIADAAIRTTAKRSVNCSKNRNTSGRPLARGSSFRPNLVSRAATSSPLNPRGELLSSPYTSRRGSVWIGTPEVVASDVIDEPPAAPLGELLPLVRRSGVQPDGGS